MKVNVHIEVSAYVVQTEARLVQQADLFLDINKDLHVQPWYIRDARFVDVTNHGVKEQSLENDGQRMVEMELGDPEADPPNWHKKLFHPDEEISIVRVR